MSVRKQRFIRTFIEYYLIFGRFVEIYSIFIPLMYFIVINLFFIRQNSPTWVFRGGSRILNFHILVWRAFNSMWAYYWSLSGAAVHNFTLFAFSPHAHVCTNPIFLWKEWGIAVSECTHLSREFIWLQPELSSRIPIGSIEGGKLNYSFTYPAVIKPIDFYYNAWLIKMKTSMKNVETKDEILNNVCM